MVQVSLSQDDSRGRTSGRLQDLSWTGISSLLLAPPEFSHLVVGPPVVKQLIRAVWPRWAVSVNDSVTNPVSSPFLVFVPGVYPW